MKTFREFIGYTSVNEELSTSEASKRIKSIAKQFDKAVDELCEEGFEAEWIITKFVKELVKMNFDEELFISAIDNI